MGWDGSRKQKNCLEGYEPVTVGWYVTSARPALVPGNEHAAACQTQTTNMCTSRRVQQAVLKHDTLSSVLNELHEFLVGVAALENRAATETGGTVDDDHEISPCS